MGKTAAPPEQPWLHGSLIAALIAGGLLLGILSVGGFRLGRLAATPEAMVSLAEIEAAVARSRLWLERCERGEQLDSLTLYAELGFPLQETHRLLEDDLDPASAAALAGTEVRALIDDLAIQLEAHRDRSIAEQQLCASPSAQSPDRSEADADLDAALSAAAAALAEATVHHRRRARAALVGLLAFGLASLLTGGAVFVHREKRRQGLASALEKSRNELMRVQKMDAVGRLAGGLAHDVNNYLAAIQGHCEVLLLAEPEPRVARKLEAIRRIVQKASVLIDQLLAFGRRQTGEPRVVRMNRTIAELEKMLRRLAGETVRLELELEPDLWPVEIDPSRLEQVIVNLVVNARDAIRASKRPEGGRIVLSTANHRTTSLDPDRAPQHRELVILAVRDDGVGIEDTARERIFEPFFSTKEHSVHGGLGLAIVFTIVTESGGHVEVESEPGAGSLFRVFLPRSEAPPDEEQETESLTLRGGTEAILLIDDNDDARAATRALLDALGYRVTAASTAADALELVEDEALEPDLVLCDLVLPDLGGVELVERLQRRRPLLPVIYVSGQALGQLAGRRPPPEGTPFLRKPFTAHGLAATLRQELDRRGSD